MHYYSLVASQLHFCQVLTLASSVYTKVTTRKKGLCNLMKWSSVSNRRELHDHKRLLQTECDGP